jgi:hypothetical protein
MQLVHVLMANLWTVAALSLWQSSSTYDGSYCGRSPVLSRF